MLRLSGVLGGPEFGPVKAVFVVLSCVGNGGEVAAVFVFTG